MLLNEHALSENRKREHNLEKLHTETLISYNEALSISKKREEKWHFTLRNISQFGANGTWIRFENKNAY